MFGLVADFRIDRFLYKMARLFEMVDQFLTCLWCKGSSLVII